MRNTRICTQYTRSNVPARICLVAWPGALTFGLYSLGLPLAAEGVAQPPDLA